MYKLNDRRSVSDELLKYDYLSKTGDFVEITEWTNGEGWDITFGGCSNNLLNTISLTEGQLDAINFLTKVLKYQK